MIPLFFMRWMFYGNINDSFILQIMTNKYRAWYLSFSAAVLYLITYSLELKYNNILYCGWILSLSEAHKKLQLIHNNTCAYYYFVVDDYCPRSTQRVAHYQTSVTQNWINRWSSNLVRTLLTLTVFVYWRKLTVEWYYVSLAGIIYTRLLLMKFNVCKL